MGLESFRLLCSRNTWFGCSRCKCPQKENINYTTQNNEDRDKPLYEFYIVQGAYYVYYWNNRSVG